MAEQIMTRAEAVALGLKFYFTGKLCRKGHDSERISSSAKCKECERIRLSSQEFKELRKRSYREALSKMTPEELHELREKNNKKNRGCYAKNKEENARKKKEYFERNKERIYAYNREYYKKNRQYQTAANSRRRARKSQSESHHTHADIERIFLRQKKRCACCNCALDKFHVDHIFPLALGGSNGVENIQILCPTCNMRKGGKDPFEWARLNGRLL